MMLLIWLALFATVTVLSLKRAAWGVAVYMLTFYASPPFWWWGGPVAGYRWNLYGGVILLIAVLLNKASSPGPKSTDPPLVGRMRKIAILILLNAGAVHVLFAGNAEISWEVYTLLAKFVLLFFLIEAAIETRQDMQLVMMVVLLGAAYIGYEATINERGKIIGGRLEGVGAPGARQANELASLLVSTLPFYASFLLGGRAWTKIMAFCTAPFTLNVIILCNSRGAFLAAIMSAFTFIAAASGRLRRKAVVGIALGAFAAFMLMGDAAIIERFKSTFADADERDASAAGRLDYWKAGLHMIADHPLGAGGAGFHSVYGMRYIRQVTGEDFEARSVHNGYINETADWGIQGLILRLAFFGTAIFMLIRSVRKSVSENQNQDALTGVALISGIFAFLVTAVFGDFIDNEWGYWLLAFATAHVRVTEGSSDGNVISDCPNTEANTAQPSADSGDSAFPITASGC